MSGITGFFIAAGAVSAIIFTLVLRADRLRDRRRAYADSSAHDCGGISSSNDSFNLLNWFGGSSSSSSGDSCTSSSSFFSGDSSSSDSSDSSCSDGGGGGDSGGGGGGD
jgi:hypothetical protein